MLRFVPLIVLIFQTHSTTFLPPNPSGGRIYTIISGPEFGSHVDNFNLLISEYFRNVFGIGGEKYLENFPHVSGSALSNPKLRDHIIGQIEKVVSYYGKGSIGGFVKNALAGHVPDTPRYRIHVLLGLLRFLTIVDLPNRDLVISNCLDYTKPSSKSDYGSQIKKAFPHVQDTIQKMNSLFSNLGFEVSAKYLELVDGLANSLSADTYISELFHNFYAWSWGAKTSGHAKFLGAVRSATSLCNNETMPEWTILPMICEYELGGKFLLNIFHQITRYRHDQSAFGTALNNADMPIWYVFNPDFILNRLDGPAGTHIRWTLSASLEIFKSNLETFSAIAWNRNNFVDKIFGHFVTHHVGRYVSPFLESSQVNELENFLAIKDVAICEKAKELEITVICESEHCRRTTHTN